MAIWRVTIQKYLAAAGRYWTNVYHVDVADGAAAQTAANAIVTMERGFHTTGVLFTSCRVDDNTPDTDIYDTFSINAFGLNSPSSTLLPLHNVFRVDFNTQGSGRPSRKYYRGVLDEGVATFTTIAAGSVSSWQSSINTVIGAQPLVDVDGQEIINAEAYPLVAMRQLTRGSKKKTTP